jgi:hypothetical protein
MTFNSANVALIEQLQSVRLHDGLSRFITIGSLGRTASLGARIEDYDSPNPNRFHDVDVLDRLGLLQGKYIFPNGAALDAQFTRIFRPILGEPNGWELMEEAGCSTRIAKISSEALRLHEVIQKDLGTGLTVMDISAMYAFECMCTALMQRRPKHKTQLRDLAVRAQAQSAHALTSEWQGVIDAAQNVVAQSTYTALRKWLFRVAPGLGLSISDGRVGSLIRDPRGTKPAVYSDTFENLLSSVDEPR